MATRTRDEPHLTVLLHQYDALRAELRTLLATAYGAGAFIAAVLGAAFVIAFQYDRPEILVVLPFVACALLAVMIDIYYHITSLKVYLTVLEEQIGQLSPRSDMPLLAWETLALPIVWGPAYATWRSPVTQALLLLGGTGVFVLLLWFAAEFIADREESEWKTRLYIAVFVAVASFPWAGLLYVLLRRNPRRLNRLYSKLRKTLLRGED